MSSIIILQITENKFFKSVSHPVHQNIMAAEFRNTVMIAYHNTDLFLSDYIGQMKRKIYPTQRLQSFTIVQGVKLHAF